MNNAGVDQPPDSGGNRSSIDTLAIDEFRRMVEVNLLGTFQVTQVIGGRMAARDGGVIVNIGSLYASVSPDQRLYDHLPGDLPFLKSPAYGASKAAVVNLPSTSPPSGALGACESTHSPLAVCSPGRMNSFDRSTGRAHPWVGWRRPTT